MDLLEYEGKQLFAQHGITVPDGTTDWDAELPDTDQLVVKAQVPVGKREEHGGIQIVDTDDARTVAEDMLGTAVAGEPVDTVLVEEAVDIDKELYVSLSINRAGKQYHLVFSEQGGSGIEDVAAQDPGAVHIMDFYELDRDALARELEDVAHSEEVLNIIEKMYRLMLDEDALLVEINPLVVTADGELVATDAKVRIDENALYRHSFQFDRDQSLEAEAEEQGLEFVDLDGNIAVIGNGAGLVMATLDSITHYGGDPADFLDIGGGADFAAMQEAMRLAMEQEHVDGLFVNIFGGITRCDEVAEGIITFVEEHDMQIPLVVRMVGTNQEQGRQMLEDNGIHALDGMDACAEKIVELVEPGTMEAEA